MESRERENRRRKRESRDDEKNQREMENREEEGKEEQLNRGFLSVHARTKPVLTSVVPGVSKTLHGPMS